MKQLFFSLVVICGATFASAQHFEIGISGGVSYSNSAILGQEIKEYRTVTENASKCYSPSGTVRATYGYKNWKAGISAGFREERFTETYIIPWGCFGEQTVSTNATDVLIPVSAVVIRKFVIYRFEPFCGVSYGYVLRGPSRLAEPIYFVSHSYGYTESLQLGCTYNFAKKIGFNIEASGNRTVVKSGSGDNAKTAGLISYPVTLGISYKL